MAPYDARAGAVCTDNGRTVLVGSQGGRHSVFGTDASKWLLAGPAKGPVAAGE